MTYRTLGLLLTLSVSISLHRTTFRLYTCSFYSTHDLRLLPSVLRRRPPSSVNNRIKKRCILSCTLVDHPDTFHRSRSTSELLYLYKRYRHDLYSHYNLISESPKDSSYFLVHPTMTKVEVP